MTFEEACQAIVDAGNDPKQVNQVNYAVNYAYAGIYRIPKEDAYARKVQALYILGNITRWRGDKAKEVRAFLKAFSK
jgi:hypothetical protein